MKTIMEMAQEANLPSCHLTHPKALLRFSDLVAERERQHCIDLLEGLHASQSSHNYYLYASDILKKMRGNQ